jgi:two-component system chemotaxis response regulator CheY
MEILIIDDDPVTCQILRASLVRAGYSVIERHNGQDGWECIQDQSIRLVITDWMMPDLEGPELIRRVREANFEKYMYMIILTGKGDKTDIIQGLTAGADDYLVKPVDLEELYARINIGKRILDLEERLTMANEQLEAMAMHDSLTQLLNRRAIYNHAEAELNRAKRDTDPVSILLIDIDTFKRVNDTHGHLIGDYAICHIADCIRGSVRSYDWIGRWGGDEFLVVLPQTDPIGEKTVAERIRDGIHSSPLPLHTGENLFLTVSIGASSAGKPEELSLELLLQRADNALYQAKQDGRNCIAVWHD